MVRERFHLKKLLVILNLKENFGNVSKFRISVKIFKDAQKEEFLLAVFSNWKVLAFSNSRYSRRGRNC